MTREGIRLAVFLWLLMVAGTAASVEALRLSMDALQGESWRGKGLVVNIADNGNSSFSLALTLAQLVVGDAAFGDIRLSCAAAVRDDSGAVSCANGELLVATSSLGKLGARVSWRYLAAGDWQLSLDLLEIPGGRLKIQANRQSQQLLADIDAGGLPLTWLQPWLPKGWTLAGRLRGKGTIRLEGGERSSISFAGALDKFSWSSADGLQVGEDVGLAFSLQASGDASQWRGELEAGIASGQLYSDPLFLETSADAPLKLVTGFELPKDGRQLLLLRKLRLSHARILDLHGDLDMDLASGLPNAFNLDFALDDLQQAYGVLLQPLVIGTPLDDLVVQGRARGKIRMAAGVLTALSMDLDGTRVEHNGGMFGVNGLRASLNWRRAGAVDFSRLGWQSAHLYRIGLGAMEALFKASGGSLRLQPLSIPLLGGRLMLHDLEMTGLLDGGPAWETQADLDDLQLLELSRAMGWPDMRGKLQATIPRIQYRDAVLRMEGELKLDVFGGEVVVEGLELQEPLGVAPVLQTNLRFANLDLEQITQVFSFGRIEGSLEGQVHDLQLVGWEVAAFDASLHSPARDRRPHRISQRAIDNLTELGNGASVQLSATMLRFFEDFAYDSLALKVKLRGTTAELDGVPRPQGGYYIVKGARLPRIDVIGRNHRIAWKELLSRIRDIRFDDMIVE